MRPIPGPPVPSVLASAAGIGSGVGALGGGAGFLIFLPFALLDPTKSGASNGAGLAIFFVPIAMVVGAIIGLGLALALAVALMATEWMGTAMVVFPATAGLVSAGTMAAWSADLSHVSQLAVGLLSGIASSRMAHQAFQRTDVDGAARAARRARAEETRPTTSKRWRVIGRAAVVPILGVAVLRSNVQHGLDLGIGWVDVTWWARDWTQVAQGAGDIRWWFYLATYVLAAVVWTAISRRPNRVVTRLVLLAILIECFEASFLLQFASTGDVAAAGLGALAGAIAGALAGRTRRLTGT